MSIRDGEEDREEFISLLFKLMMPLLVAITWAASGATGAAATRGQQQQQQEQQQGSSNRGSSHRGSSNRGQQQQQ